MQYIEGLKQLSRSFEEMVVQFCKEQGVESFRVSALFSYFSQEEIEKMEKYKNLIGLEENVKMLLLKNQYYLNVLLKLQKVLWIQFLNIT